MLYVSGGIERFVYAKWKGAQRPMPLGSRCQTNTFTGTTFTPTWAVLTVFSLMIATLPGYPQAFADRKSGLVDYAKAEFDPAKSCEAMGKVKAKDIAQIEATTIPASADVPAH